VKCAISIMHYGGIVPAPFVRAPATCVYWNRWR
jgi:hypothetical protein